MRLLAQRTAGMGAGAARVETRGPLVETDTGPTRDSISCSHELAPVRYKWLRQPHGWLPNAHALRKPARPELQYGTDTYLHRMHVAARSVSIYTHMYATGSQPTPSMNQSE